MMTNCSSDFLADYCPDHAALNGAYLYDSWEDMQVIAKSDWYAGLKGQLDDSNIHVMFFGWNGGHRHMISSSRPGPRGASWEKTRACPAG